MCPKFPSFCTNTPHFALVCILSLQNKFLKDHISQRLQNPHTDHKFIQKQAFGTITWARPVFFSWLKTIKERINQQIHYLCLDRIMFFRTLFRVISCKIAIMIGITRLPTHTNQNLNLNTLHIILGYRAKLKERTKLFLFSHLTIVIIWKYIISLKANKFK